MSTELRRARLVMPGYGNDVASAGRALWNASKGPRANTPLNVVVSNSKGSLLAQNFNGAWCAALNDCHHGKPVAYFAMIHADVEAEDGWLDILVEEMEARKLDVLSAVIPIKDPKGLTSVALERPDKDTWRPLCRLTMREVFQLPETFTSADVGYSILLNTGCWVCRFDMRWATKVYFTINDRIVFNESLNIYQAQVEPEDWFFSRLCHELGLNLAATRKVKIDHAGSARYVNHQAWGREEFDTAYIEKSVLNEPAADGWRFPMDVEGWLSLPEGRALAELARGKRVLEIGSYCGRSTICMAQTAREVVSVDPHDGRGTPSPHPTLTKLSENLSRYGIENVETNIGTFGMLAATWRGAMQSPEFDLIFIDGAHDLESVRHDISHAREWLAPGGVIAFHDYREKPGDFDGSFDPGVTQAVQELISEGGELLSTHSTVAVVKPPLPLLETCNGI